VIAVFKRIRFWLTEPRIGPDMPLTHWMLQFSLLGGWLARRKFRNFGVNSEVRPFSFIVRTDRIDIGERVVLRPQTTLMASDLASIIIGNDVLIGAGVHLYASNHRYDRHDLLISAQGHSPAEDLVIEDDVWIGANAIILPGVYIGRHSVVAAGSVVTKSVPPRTLWAGVPARKIKDL
jgi:acetyltransferase-like isoleucine patch superfamily enzyme